LPAIPKALAAIGVATLKEHGTPVWYLMAKDEGRGYGKKSNQDCQFYASVLFLQQYLLK
jgi:hypothetical protein